MENRSPIKRVSGRLRRPGLAIPFTELGNKLPRTSAARPNNGRPLGSKVRSRDLCTCGRHAGTLPKFSVFFVFDSCPITSTCRTTDLANAVARMRVSATLPTCRTRRRPGRCTGSCTATRTTHALCPRGGAVWCPEFELRRPGAGSRGPELAGAAALPGS